MMLFSLFKFLFLSIICPFHAQYRIKENAIPTILNKTFTSLSELIFPNDIIIEISLSRVAGTLLYSIDSNNNQLIISLNDASVPMLDVEIRKKHIYVPLPQLCSCEFCKFEKLKLRIQFRDMLYLQCNEGVLESHKYEWTGDINKEYPIPKFSKSDKLDAYLWLVNTPPWGELYENSAQLSGCIFNVLYKMEPIEMGKNRDVGKCIKSCSNDICKPGTCLETYNRSPICNCTSSYENGFFCNDTIVSQGFSVTQPFQFKSIKLSFTGSHTRLLQLKNKKFVLELLVENNVLLLNITSYKDLDINMKVRIKESYTESAKNILVFVFEEKSINVNFSENGTYWKIIIIPHSYDLSKDTFDRLILGSNNGKIDMVYKSDVREPRWNTLRFINGKDKIPDQPEIKSSTVPSTVTSTVTSSPKFPSNTTTPAKSDYEKICREIIVLQNRVDDNRAILICIAILVIVILILVVMVLMKSYKSCSNPEKVSKESLMLNTADT